MCMCMCIRACACMCLCVHESVHVCVCVCVYECVYVCVRVCIFVLCVRIYICLWGDALMWIFYGFSDLLVCSLELLAFCP
jgi:hypothetical protein